MPLFEAERKRLKKVHLFIKSILEYCCIIFAIQEVLRTHLFFIRISNY